MKRDYKSTWKGKIMKRTLVATVLCLMIGSTPLKAGEPETVEVIIPKTTTTQEISEPNTDANVKAIDEREFRVTAYCACEICCGEWAKNRPTDEFGKPIIIGASGTQLKSGDCASPLPFGTEISLDGYGTVIVEDRTADWVVDEHGENIIDLYMDDHNEALEFGVKYMKGEIK
jgi:3D (Asp-Asp-Asp) domain-containing protein